MSGEENTPAAAVPPQCQFFVQRKKRLCRMTVKPGRQYCGEHQPQPDSEAAQADKRIPCPNDPKHTCYASKLLKHLAICNARRTEQPPYIVHNINAPEAVDTCPRLPLSSYPKDKLAQVVDKINDLYTKHVQGHITTEPSEPVHRAVMPEFSGKDRAESSRRHLRQVSALLRAAERAGLPAPATCYVELGAGKGQLSYYAAHAWCAGTRSRVLCVDRAPLRHKRDNKLRSAPPTPLPTDGQTGGHEDGHDKVTSASSSSKRWDDGHTASHEGDSVTDATSSSKRFKIDNIASDNDSNAKLNVIDNNPSDGQTGEHEGDSVTDASSGSKRFKVDNIASSDNESNAKLKVIDNHPGDGQTGGHEDDSATDATSSSKRFKIDNISDNDSNAQLKFEDRSLSKSQDNNNDNKNGETCEVAVRVRADLAHLALEAVPVVAESDAVVGLAKHLCGVATDYALRCVAGAATKARGAVLATCCHHRVERARYVAARQLQDLGINAEEFNIMLGVVSWATCGDGRSRERRLRGEGDAPSGEGVTPPGLGVDLPGERVEGVALPGDGVASPAEGVARQGRREETGRRAKALLDWGRVLWLRARGFDARLCYYVQRDVSLENVAIVAVKR